MNKSSIESEKSKIRKEILGQLKNQSVSERWKKSDQILSQISQLNEFKKSRAIMFYVSMLEEVDTLPLLKAVLKEGRTVTVPRVDQKNRSLLSIQIENPETDLSPGSYGILEPKERRAPFDIHELECVLVPGIAFDHKGHRLGRGKGYYDRFLKSLPKKVKTFGLAFDFQLMDSIPVNELDVMVGQVVTN